MPGSGRRGRDWDENFNRSHGHRWRDERDHDHAGGRNTFDESRQRHGHDDHHGGRWNNSSGSRHGRGRDDDEEVTVGPVRPADGADSNTDYPDYGAAGQTLLRLGGPNFADGIGAMAGDGLPNPRTISNAVSAQEGDEPNDLGASGFLWAWGQFVDHDLDLTEAGTTETAPIIVPDGDPVFALGSEIAFSRAEPIEGTGEMAPRQYANEITAFLDASMVYGSDAETAAALRGIGGKLLIGEDGLLFPSGAGVLAGDIRAAENVALTALHTLFVREHNWWVERLSEEDPWLSDDELYTAARNRVEAEVQAITFNEFLPILVGEDAMPGYEGYDLTVNPGISIEFSTAAFRFGHSLLTSTLQRLEENGETIGAGNLSLRDAFFAPGELATGGIEAMFRGLADSFSLQVDPQIVEDVRSFLFAGPDGPGLDLASINIQRGRDLGVSSYNDLRESMGLARATDFSDVTSDPALAAQLQALYGDVDLIDAWIGGLAEDHVAGGLLGELFAVIIADQFVRIRAGDPFWSEAGGLPADEFEALWSTTLADIIERNTEIGDIQDDVFMAYDRTGGDNLDNDLIGSDALDLLLGESGNDLLVGNAGGDQLIGGPGRDRLVGGEGDDLLEGGPGRDVFVFTAGEAGENVIADFGRGDVIELNGFDMITDFDDIDIFGDATETTVALPGGQSIALPGVDIDTFNQDDVTLI